MFACSGLFGSNCESPDWPSQVHPAAPASGAARLLSTQVLFTVVTAVTSRAWRMAALVGQAVLSRSHSGPRYPPEYRGTETHPGA